MPRNVDHDERRRDIARAGIRLMAKHGPRGLTLRALADELGGSITMVTHFFPNRRTLLDAVSAQLVEEGVTELESFDRQQLDPSERLRAFLMWLLPTTDQAMQLERGRVLMSSESDAHFNVQEFFDNWERTIRELIERYIAPLVPAGQLQLYVDLLRVIQNGVVLSSVEHPKYWTPEQQIEFINGLVPLIQGLSTPAPPARNRATPARKRP